MILALLARIGIPQWLAEVILGGLIVIALAGGGYRIGWKNATDDAELALQQAQLEAAEKLRIANERSDKMAADLAAAQFQTQQIYQKLTAEVSHVVTVYRPTPSAPLRDLPQCVFTDGFVRVWNQSADPALRAAAGVDAAVISETDLAPSDVRQEDVLNNHVANASQDAAIRQQCQALIEWHRTVGGRQ
jgi:hypothetical protein